MKTSRDGFAWMMLGGGVMLALFAGACASQSTAGKPEQSQPAAGAGESDLMAEVNTIGQDRGVWQQLLSDHTKIRRKVVHREQDGVGFVEATTESEDPAVAARIIEHAKAMQTRMKAGALVRAWDPVFVDLFKNHTQVALEVTPTAKGVTIVESSRDPQAIALLRSHAMGVSDFVRHGHESGGRETARVPVGVLPASEVAIGGLPHRFLLSQPAASQIGLLKQQGVTKVVNFRKHSEHEKYDESAAAASAQLGYCNIPFKESAELTDEVFRETREELKRAGETGASIALHCRTGNRVGPGLAAYLALDCGKSMEEAIACAKAVGMVDPQYETITRDYIQRGLASGVSMQTR